VKRGRPAFTIVRPTLVYDAGGGQEVLMYLAYLKRFPVVPFIGAGGAKKRPVWAEDVVDGLLRVAGSDVALGKTYNLSGAESITMLEFSRLLLAHEGRDRPFLHLPVFLCRAVAALLALCMEKPPLTPSSIAGIVNDADLDPSRAVEELGYRPLAVRQGLPLHFGPNGAPCAPVAVPVGAPAASRLEGASQ